MSDLCDRSATELARAIREKEVSSVEVVDAFLERIAARNPSLNAIVTLNEPGARARAKLADAALAKGAVWGPLHGVPVTFKDVFETAGLRTTAGHPPLRDYVPNHDATVVARVRGAGAIVLGKTNTPPLAMDTQCENALFGRTLNPWDPERTSGGSSGGEAAALAAGMSALGFGSDVGGSVRIPAHFCGVFALKPTEGRVPQTGHVPPLPGAPRWIRHFAASGPLGRSVEDLRLGLEVIAGPDGQDLSVAPAPLVRSEPRALRDYRFAWTDELGGLAVSAETRRALHSLVASLERAGCRVERATPEAFDLDEAWRIYGELVGIMMATQAPALARVLLAGLGRVIFRKDPVTGAGTRRALAGTKTYYALLERREHLARSLEAFLSRYDAWLTPVSRTPAVRHRARGRINTPIDVDGVLVPGHLGVIGYTSPLNLTGHPAVVVPLGAGGDGLPIGLQLVGRRWDEMNLLNVAQAVSDVTTPGV